MRGRCKPFRVDRRLQRDESTKATVHSYENENPRVHGGGFHDEW